MQYTYHLIIKKKQLRKTNWDNNIIGLKLTSKVTQHLYVEYSQILLIKGFN